jgi:abelson tyrosine-protein kinase 1/abelson tyrosine-protein kinase 2
MVTNSTTTARIEPAITHTIPEEPEHSGAVTPTSPISPVPSSPAEIRARLHAVRQKQNEHDAGLDLVDLRQLMRTALQTSNDTQMIEVLQVGRVEMPEAIKTLQRALEREVEKENVNVIGSAVSSRATTSGTATTAGTNVVSAGFVSGQAVAGPDGRRASLPVTSTHEISELERRKTIASTGAGSQDGGTTASLNMTASATGGSTSGSDGRIRDTLDREFIESGIDALRRVSDGPDKSLPSWTITKWVVHFFTVV